MGSEAQIHIFYAYKASVSPTGQTAAQIGGFKERSFCGRDCHLIGKWGEEIEGRETREGLGLGLKIVSTKL